VAGGFRPGSRRLRGGQARCLAAGAPTAKDDRVARIGDGDTIALEHLGVVRLLGIDAPQADTRPAECFADAATAGARDLLAPGSAVRVTLGAPARDTFGRALAYVWTDDGRLANDELLARGDARALIVSPNNRYEQSLRLAQRRVRPERGAASGALADACARFSRTASGTKPPKERLR